MLHVPGIGSLTFSSEAIRQELANTYGASAAASANLPPPAVLLTITFFAAIIAGFSINALFALGEELGWRGFLWDRLRPYGALGKIILGVIWGLWHAPIILLGYNFPQHPFLGILFMIFFTISLTFPLTYLRDETHSVYAPSSVHGMINASGIFSFIVIGKNDLLGSFVGILGCAAILLAWVIIFQIPKFLKLKK